MNARQGIFLQQIEHSRNKIETAKKLCLITSMETILPNDKKQTMQLKNGHCRRTFNGSRILQYLELSLLRKRARKTIE